MVGIMTLHRSTIGKKVIMALTGLVWIGYLAAHMFGNLKVFTGAVHFNEYAEGLRTLGAPIFGYSQVLWAARIIFIVSIAAHVWAAVSLSRLNRIGSRPVNYQKQKKLRANSAQLTMIYGGVAILLFIIFHLMQLTFGTAAISPNFALGDAYGNVINAFQGNYLVVGIYLVALVAVGMHLYHSTWSVFQTLGLNNKDYTKALRGLSIVVALVITLGFAIVPIAVVTGFIR